MRISQFYNRLFVNDKWGYGIIIYYYFTKKGIFYFEKTKFWSLNFFPTGHTQYKEYLSEFKKDTQTGRTEESSLTVLLTNSDSHIRNWAKKEINNVPSKIKKIRKNQ